jgi:putative tricarboxylic transport membrane protein
LSSISSSFMGGDYRQRFPRGWRQRFDSRAPRSCAASGCHHQTKQGDTMRRDTFLKSLAALAAAGTPAAGGPRRRQPEDDDPANPGGGWDSTGRALGKALQEAGVATAVTYDNKGGAAGAIGLAQFVNASKGDPNALMVMGAGDAGRHHHRQAAGEPDAGHADRPPDQRVQRLRAARQSPLKTMKDVVEQMKKDPGSVKWGGGSRGSTEHIAIAMIAREVGVDPTQDQLRALPRRRRGHGGHPGRQRHRRRQRLQRVPAVHRKRQDARHRHDLGRAPEGHQRAHAEGAGHQRRAGQLARRLRRARHHDAQRKALTDMIVKATKTKAWAEALEKNNWTPA